MSRDDFPSAILTPTGLGLWVAIARHPVLRDHFEGGWLTYCMVRR